MSGVGPSLASVAALHRSFMAGERDDLRDIGWITAYRIARLLDGDTGDRRYVVGSVVQGVSGGQFGTFVVTAVRHGRCYVSHIAGPIHVHGMMGYDNLWFDPGERLIWGV